MVIAASGTPGARLRPPQVLAAPNGGLTRNLEGKALGYDDD